MMDFEIFSCLAPIYRLTLYLSAVLVLTAAVTQASLQSMLHKLLTAGPSAFNLTSILSQAAQLSNQSKFLTFSYVLRFSFFMYFLVIWIYQSLIVFLFFYLKQPNNRTSHQCH